MASKNSDINLSKLLSYILRHGAVKEKINIQQSKEEYGKLK